jgi:excinuclease ABC subunit A
MKSRPSAAERRVDRQSPPPSAARPRSPSGFRAPSLAADEPDAVIVKGAREHNLRIDEIAIPKRSLVVFTGVSGSGKSSLAFDTIYAEGQRRYVESLSSYARQFLGQMEKPKYDQIRGLSPTIAIEQKTASSNPRSTVGTVTEIYDYMRVLYARAGEQRCPDCDVPVAGRSAAEIVTELQHLAAGTTVTLLSPKVDLRKGEFRELFDELRAAGFARARVDGEVTRLEDLTGLDKKRKHTIEIVVDRVKIGPDTASRLADSVETALKHGAGRVLVEAEGQKPRLYAEDRTCPSCRRSLPEIVPASLSYNSPLGMCNECNGLGTRLEVDAALVIPDPSLTIDEGAIEPWRSAGATDEGWTGRIAHALTRELGVPRDKPWKKLTPKQKEMLLQGTGDRRVAVSWKGKHGQGSWAMKWEGLLPQVMRRYQATQSEQMRGKYRKYMREGACTACKGTRLRAESRAVWLDGKSITDVFGMTVKDSHAMFGKLALTGARAVIAEELLKEIKSRLGFLVDVGLDYLTLHRSAATLSGGEAQRIRLASQLGSELSGVMYVLDEPSIGLHQRDNRKLIKTLERLRDLGNSVLVVEHDTEMIESADWVVDFGPGAGKEGGHVVAQGTPAEIIANPASVTGRFLSGKDGIPRPASRRKEKGAIVVEGARENNLKDITVRFPLGVLCAVTGVSGAGKSSLINQILKPALRNKLAGASEPVGAHDGIVGIEHLDKIVDIDQRPIGRTPRSNPATYTKAFDLIRDVLSQTKEARAFGYGPGRFSFNVKGGRCESCEGAGVREVEMHFLPNVFVTCEACKGKRYNDATLRVGFRGKNISDILDTSVHDAAQLFGAIPPLSRILNTIDEVGLGYVSLGQPATTLSGGEAQRIKLSRELARRDTGRTLYVLDEPTTGLHFADTKRLLEVLQRLVDAGNSVLVIEHNLDVVAAADWIVDIGPEGGNGGGRVIAEGTPEEVAAVAASYTGQHLAEMGVHAAARADKKRRKSA